ncbi:hypothetical protein QBE55_06030 [Eubacteriales bacterium mix99]|jgi:hypothetical protein|nr:hypothetical protein [Clostridiales bacterium]
MEYTKKESSPERPQNPQQTRPAGTDIRKMVQDDRVLALCELSGDLLFHKIPHEKIPRFVDGSLSAGHEAARAYRGKDMEALYAQKNIKILWKESGETRIGVTWRGQSAFGKNGCEVTLVRESIRTLAENSSPMWDSPSGDNPLLSPQDALQLHLAHEFFHYLEYESNDPVSSRMDEVVTFQLLGWKRHAHINKCSEVAAHAFAKEVLGLPVLPNYFDYLYLVHTEKMTQTEFEAFLAHSQSVLNR